jgi:hypothetical protein
MAALEDFAEGYNKIHDYLLANGQQELAGHLDGIWQHTGKLQQTQNAADAAAPANPNAQEFQDQYKGDNPKTVDKTEAQVDADNAES